MTKKKFFGSIKENTAIIIGAAFVAFGLFFISKNPDFFTASVLSLQEKTFMVEKGRDIAYKTNSGYVDIFMSENLETVKSIDFTISFDKDTITTDTKNMSGQGLQTVKNSNEESIVIQSLPNGNIDKSQSLLLLPFSGENKDILLSEAVATLDTGKEQNLSIGSLNEISSHTK